jgi:hypothetical protein
MAGVTYQISRFACIGTIGHHDLGYREAKEDYTCRGYYLQAVWKVSVSVANVGALIEVNM